MTTNFDEGNLTAGTIVTNQFEGFNISTPSEYGVMVFDTARPTGEDYDLAADNLGNVLIISEDGDESDPDARATGGTINIEFDEPSTLRAIGLLDIEESGSFVNLFDEESNLIETIDIEPVGDGRSFELDISNSGVARLELNLAGSGALTSLDFSPDDISTPVTQLTDTGWEQDGQLLGMWTDESDIVEGFSGIEVADTVTANTLAGDDLIYAVASNEEGLLNQGSIIMGNGDDLLQGSAIGEGNEFVGILNDQGTNEDSDSFTTISDRRGQIEVNGFVGNIETGAGADTIIGSVEIDGNSRSNTGILNRRFGSIKTGEDSDEITGSVKIKGDGDFNDGIFSEFIGLIDTGMGNDQITAAVEVEGNGNGNRGFLNNSFTITDTGAGDDRITATVEVGGNGNDNTGIINGEAKIETGSGDDYIFGAVKVAGDGSGNQGFSSGLAGIDMGNGDDYLYGAVEVEGEGENNFGIYSFLNSIYMGAGNDEITGVGVDAYTGFGASSFGDGSEFSFINLGDGNDKINGFGNQHIVDGGTGTDIAKFEFDFDESVTLGSNEPNSIEITANEVTMSFTNVEEFVFANGTFAFDELIDLV